MDHRNVSTITYFFITGISDEPFVFLLVLLVYLITLVENLTIFLLICIDHHLHKPMYFFLANLSILDITCSAITFHKIFSSFISGDNIVSVLQCRMQIIAFLLVSCYELLVLTVMSYDRYVAICKPLHYNLIMNLKLCALLTLFCWICGFLEGLPLFMGIFQLTCFKSNEMDYFFCDIMPFLKLTCSDISFLQLYIYIVGGLVTGLIPFTLIFISYIFIIGTILSIRSSGGRRKAFYTCSSHLTVVICFYASLNFQYMRPSTAVNLGYNKFFSLLNGAAVPILNPLIYSLKNKDVKAALARKLRFAVSTNIQTHERKM
ncbi:olfactory receptor 6C1-like [Anomaloglossus baeobatrachus]|uniref:olfactory receptor 6C1-like n=1 Tax=Anomaloglossus baeobatrachus TaxID=238106 RepID=UPI003F507C36